MSGKKHIALLLVCCFLLTSVAIPTSASDHDAFGEYDNGVFGIKDGEETGEESENIESLIYNSDTRAQYEKNKPGYMERSVASFFISIVKWVMNTFHVADPVVLIYNKDIGGEDGDNLSGFLGTTDRDSLVLGIFPEPYFNGITVLYTMFEKLLPIPLVIAVIIIALVLMFGAGTVRGLSAAKEYATSIIIAIVVLRYGHYLWTWVTEANNFMVDLVWVYMMEHGVQPGALMDVIWGGRQGFEGSASMNTISIALLLLMAGFMILALNFQYVMRAIIIGLLIVLFPVVVALSVFPFYRGKLEMWVQEFFANVIIQFAHALVLGGFFLALYSPGIGKGGMFWLMLVYVMGLPAIAGLIRSMMGLKAGFGGIMGGVSSIGGMLGGIGGMIGKAGGAKSKMPGPAVPEVPDQAARGGFKSIIGAKTGIGQKLQGAYNMAGEILSSPTGRIATGAARMGAGAAAAVAGGVLTGMLTGGDFATGARVGKGLSQSAMNGLGWVGGKVLDRVTGLSKKLPEYIENKNVMDTAQKNIDTTKPQLNLAYAEWKQAEAYYDKGSPEINKAYKKYDELRTQYRKYEADELLARTRLQNMGYIQEKAAPLKHSNTSYSESRGRV